MFTARIVWENGKVEERELSAGNDGVVTLRRDSLPRTGIRQVELHSKGRWNCIRKHSQPGRARRDIF